MLILALTGCLALRSDDPEVVFEFAWNELDAYYGGFDQRGIDWDHAYETHRPRIDASSDEDELFEVLGDLLATLDDGHVRLTAPDREVFEANHDYREHTMLGTFDEELVRTYLTDPDTGPWGDYLAGELAPGVPYIWFPNIDDNTYQISALVETNPKALVIDLRHSHGGAFTYALQGMGNLTDTEIPVWRSRSRNGPERGSFDDWMTWTLPPRAPYWNGPIYVLQDRETISASERILLALHELDDVTFIGLPSNGAQATSIGRELPNGWYLQLPVQEVEAVDGTVWEGIGLPVDIEMLNDPAEVAAGEDEMLELALSLALGD